MTGLESSIKNKEGGYKKDDERQIETMDFAVFNLCVLLFFYGGSGINGTGNRRRAVRTEDGRDPDNEYRRKRNITRNRSGICRRV